MLKVLLKKQMAEVFRGFYINRKTNQPRSKSSVILMFVLFGFLIIGVLSGTFTFVAVTLCKGLAPAGLGWLYFALMSGIALTLGTFGGVFNTYSGLYLPKDNEMLLSMPIPVRLIVISRLVNVYLISLIYSGSVLLPTLIVWWVIAGATVQNVICGVVLFLIVTLLVLILSCLLGRIVAAISLKLKNKSFITVLISLAFIAAYYFFYFRAQVLMQDLIANAEVYGENIKGSAYVLYLFGRIGEGDWAAAGIFLAAAAALLALALFILSRGFLKLATAGGNTKKVRYTEKRAKQKSLFGAVFMKELSRFTSSPNYMLNCGMGVLLLPALGVFLLIKGADFLSAVNVLLPGIPDCGALLLCAALMILSATNDIAAPSVSLEGKSIWLLQSMPIEPKTVLKAKASLQLLMTGIPMLFAVICGAAVTPTSVLNKLLLCAVALLFTVFMSLFDTFSGVRKPILDWMNEIVPIKQGGAVLLALFGGWGFVILFVVPYLFLGNLIGLTLYLTLWAVVYAVASAALYRWLTVKGAAAFARL